MTIRQDYTHENVTATATGQTELGPAMIHEFGGTLYAKRVTVQQSNGASDAQWNVNLDGNALFSVTQSVSASNTFETFVPDQNHYASSDPTSVEADVTTAGSSGPLLFGVLLETVADE